MADPAGVVALHLTGDLSFLAGGMESGFLTGAFLKAIVDNGNNTYTVTTQQADGSETTVTVAGGAGATITSGTADPTGGAAGDAYLQINASNVITSIWRNVSGTWAEYTLPAGGVDQTARDAAAAAQSAAALAQVTASDAHAEADAAQTDIDEHEAMHPSGGGLPALPAPGSRDVVTNAAGTAYTLTPHFNLDDIFPRVAALPDHTAADAPSFVYLDHSITEGMREDANLTIGEAAGFYGYSNLAPKFGTINKTSPLIQLVGQATAQSITEVWSTNSAWLTQFTHVVLGGVEYVLGVTFQSGPYFIRNITSAPTGITALTLNINFKKTDGSYFFQGPGHLTLFNEGWYELLSNGYSRIASTGYLHTSGQGGPIGKPTYEGQRFVNEFGQLWVAGGERARVQTPASGTNAPFVHDEYNRDATIVQQAFDRSGDGAWSWPLSIQPVGNFWQIVGTSITDIDYTRTWLEINTYVASRPAGDTAANIRRRDHSVFLGGFSTFAKAITELGNRVTQQIFDAGATDYYYGYTGEPTTDRGVRQILTYTAAVNVINNDLFWKGPLLDENDVQELIDEGAVEVNGSANVDKGNANKITVGPDTWGTKPIQDRRAAGLPTATIDTLDNLYEDTRGVWRGSSYIDEERDGVGTFTDVVFGGAINRFIGIFGRLTGLESLHPASGRANGDFAIVSHNPNPGFYSALNGHWVLAHTDADVQALLDTLAGNSAGDSRYWGWHGNAVLAMHRRGAIDDTKKYYFFNYSAQRLQLLGNTTYIAGTEAGTVEYDFTLATPASGATERVLYESADTGVAMNASASLIPGNIVCPTTGHLELYFEQITGDRKGSIAQATIPAARLRAKINTVGFSHTSDNPNAITLSFAENRALSMACITTTFYIMITAQSVGNYYIHIAHRP